MSFVVQKLKAILTERVLLQLPATHWPTSGEKSCCYPPLSFSSPPARLFKRILLGLPIGRLSRRRCPLTQFPTEVGVALAAAVIYKCSGNNNRRHHERAL